MDHEAVDFRTLLARWAEKAKADSGGHPSAEELSEYRRHRLAVEDRERVADHIALCRRCFDLLPEVASFARAARDRDDAPADFEAAAFWRTLKPRLEDLEREERPNAELSRSAEKAPREDARRSPRRLPERRRSWSVPVALAAALAAAFFGWTSWSQHRTLAALTSPRPNVGIYDLFKDTSVRSGAVSAQALSSSGGGTLVLTPQEPGDFEDYEIRILDGEGDVAWKGRGFRKNPGDETFSLLLPPGSLPPGKYRVEILGLVNDQRHPIEEYVVQLEL